MSTLPDNADLHGKCREGDQVACQQLISQCQERIKLALKQNGLQQADVENITQNLFHKVLLNFHQFSLGSNFCNWVIRIAINEARDLHRKLKTQPRSLSSQAENSIAGTGQCPGNVLSAGEDSKALWECVDQLKPHEAAFVRRRFESGEPSRDTAMFFVDRWIDTDPLPPAAKLNKDCRNSANENNRGTLRTVVDISHEQLPPLPDGTPGQKNRQDQTSEKISEIVRNCLPKIGDCFKRKGGSL